MRAEAVPNTLCFEDFIAANCVLLCTWLIKRILNIIVIVIKSQVMHKASKWVRVLLDSKY